MTFRKGIPIKLLFVTSTSDIGGTERQILHLAPGLAAKGAGVFVLSLQGGGELTRRLESQGIRAETVVPGNRVDWRDFLAMRRVLGLRMGEFQPDIAHLFGLRAELLGRGMAGRRGIRVVSGIRSTDPWRRRWHIALDRWTARHVDLFVSNSEAGRRSRVRREGFPKEKIVVIPNGIALPDLSRKGLFREKFREAHGVPAAAPLIGLVANYRPQKGHLTALRAFARLRVDFPDLKMAFAGEDFMGGKIHRLAEKKFPGSVICLGHQKDLSGVYAALDVFVLPSQYEGTPNTLMEAMAWGVPAIASRAGGIPEVIRPPDDEGKLVEPGDAEELAERIGEVLEDGGLRKRLEENGRRRIEERFSIKSLIRRHLNLYRGLMGKGGRREV